MIIKTSAGALTNLPFRARWFPRMWDVALRATQTESRQPLPARSSTMASYLILLGTPRDLHIPYFAMPSPSSRENRVARLNLDAQLSKLAGRRCAAWVTAQKDRDKIRLVETRNYVPRQTAFYAQWLVFEKEVAFLEFLESFPHCRLDARVAKISEEREALAVDLDKRLIRRDFDLSRVGDEQQRENLARRYIEMTDNLHQFGTQFRLLETAKQLSSEWQTRL
jgi:hypothetical protein